MESRPANLPQRESLVCGEVGSGGPMELSPERRTVAVLNELRGIMRFLKAKQPRVLSVRRHLQRVR